MVARFAASRAAASRAVSAASIAFAADAFAVARSDSNRRACRSRRFVSRPFDPSRFLEFGAGLLERRLGGFGSSGEGLGARVGAIGAAFSLLDATRPATFRLGRARLELGERGSLASGGEPRVAKRVVEERLEDGDAGAKSEELGGLGAVSRGDVATAADDRRGVGVRRRAEHVAGRGRDGEGIGGSAGDDGRERSAEVGTRGLATRGARRARLASTEGRLATVQVATYLVQLARDAERGAGVHHGGTTVVEEARDADRLRGRVGDDARVARRAMAEPKRHLDRG